MYRSSSRIALPDGPGDEPDDRAGDGVDDEVVSAHDRREHDARRDHEEGGPRLRDGGFRRRERPRLQWRRVRWGWCWLECCPVQAPTGSGDGAVVDGASPHARAFAAVASAATATHRTTQRRPTSQSTRNARSRWRVRRRAARSRRQARRRRRADTKARGSVRSRRRRESVWKGRAGRHHPHAAAAPRAEASVRRRTSPKASSRPGGLAQG